MKISEHFQLNKSQLELDFIDINTTRDTPLFLDPFFLSIKNDKWSTEASKTIKSFFQKVLNLIGAHRIQDARKLFDHLEEPNSTCLGVSRDKPRGRGVGKSFSDDIFNNILNSNASRTGLIENLEDNILFIDGFGKDMLSDMTTNIIRMNLIEYTQSQCKLHGIPLTDGVASGYYWNKSLTRWEQTHTQQLIIDDRIILLVPKGIASFSKTYTSEKFYNHFVLNFLQGEEIRLKTSLVQQRKDGTPFVTKDSLKEQNPLTKEFLADFSLRNPNIFENFKNRSRISSLTNHEIADLKIPDLIQHLITELTSIEKGNADANRYHKLITGILEIIFYPFLIHPQLEHEIHEGRKRIDISFDNAAETGIFWRLHQSMNMSCQYIMIECKNYSSDPTNPELDQLSGRFSPNRGKVGFLLCREIQNLDLFINRCRDTYTDQRGLIVPITDEDIINLLTNYRELDNSYLEKFLSDRIRKITF